ncbi:MAG: hypothetical protein KME16_11840 [Scytolyngbya sp. HA4215-MV1]|jgi:hypothetical protein|nr:hypothetical protein [Scytolyngbya sp. HA4215-MV1]
MPARPFQSHPAVGYEVRLLPENTHPLIGQNLAAEGVIAQVWQFSAGLMVSVQLDSGVIVDGLLFRELTDRDGTPLRWR